MTRPFRSRETALQNECLFHNVWIILILLTIVQLTQCFSKVDKKNIKQFWKLYVVNIPWACRKDFKSIPHSLVFMLNWYLPWLRFFRFANHTEWFIRELDRSDWCLLFNSLIQVSSLSDSMNNWSNKREWTAKVVFECLYFNILTLTP